MALTWIDYFIIVVIATSAIIGVFRGFVNEVLSLVVWIVALWVAFRFSIHLSSVFISYIPQPSLRYGISFVILLLATLITGGLIRWVFNKVVESTGLGGINRSIGLVFGLIRGILLVAILIFMADFTKLPTSHAWIHSALLPHFHPFVSWLQQWLPAGFSSTHIATATGKA